MHTMHWEDGGGQEQDLRSQWITDPRRLHAEVDYLFVYECLYAVCACICVYIKICMYKYIFVRLHMHICPSPHTHAYIYVNTYICMIYTFSSCVFE